MSCCLELEAASLGVNLCQYMYIQWNLDLTKSLGNRPNLFVKWRVRYIENLDITNLKGNDQNVCYIEVIVND